MVLSEIEAVPVSPGDLVFMDAPRKAGRKSEHLIHVPPKMLDKEIKDFRSWYIDEENGMPNVIEMGFEERFHIPLAEFDIIESTGILRHLSPLNRSLFAIVRGWTRQHTSAKVRGHIAGARVVRGGSARFARVPGGSGRSMKRSRA